MSSQSNLGNLHSVGSVVQFDNLWSVEEYQKTENRLEKMHTTAFNRPVIRRQSGSIQLKSVLIFYCVQFCSHPHVYYC